MRSFKVFVAGKKERSIGRDDSDAQSSGQSSPTSVASYNARQASGPQSTAPSTPSTWTFLGSPSTSYGTSQRESPLHREARDGAAAAGGSSSGSFHPLKIPSGAKGGSSGGKGKDEMLNKTFGYSKNIMSKYDFEHEIGRGHFGHTIAALAKKGERKGKRVAIKIIPKAKMTTAIAIEDVKREVSILKALAGHPNVVQFFEAYEDPMNVYIVMELCEGGELLERILDKGGRYAEAEAKEVVRQVLHIVAFCHQHGVIHRDLKLENFLLAKKDDDLSIRAIDFGLSGFIKPDQRLKDIVGSAYYIAPEVLHKSYGSEADMWSVGVITFILLCGSRPFWSRTESGIFQAIVRKEPNFADVPWNQLSDDAADFVRRCLSKDLRRRPSAAQALAHPWVRSSSKKVPFDVTMYKNVRNFFKCSAPRKHALRALVTTVTDDELFYLRGQFSYIDTNKDGLVGFEDFRVALAKVSQESRRDSGMLEIMHTFDRKQCEKINFGEFCAASVSVNQLEGMSNYLERARCAHEQFLAAGHGALSADAIAQEIGVADPAPSAAVLAEWTSDDGTISFLGFTRLLHGPSRSRLKEAAKEGGKDAAVEGR
eukprot:jgi/Mesen1/2543/ME000161S01592